MTAGQRGLIFLFSHTEKVHCGHTSANTIRFDQIKYTILCKAKKYAYIKIKNETKTRKIMHISNEERSGENRPIRKADRTYAYNKYLQDPTPRTRNVLLFILFYALSKNKMFAKKGTEITKNIAVENKQ